MRCLNKSNRDFFTFLIFTFQFLTMTEYYSDNLREFCPISEATHARHQAKVRQLNGQFTSYYQIHILTSYQSVLVAINLGLDVNCPPSRLRFNIKMLKKMHHPDKCRDGDATARFQLLNNALEDSSDDVFKEAFQFYGRSAFASDHTFVELFVTHHHRTLEKRLSGHRLTKNQGALFRNSSPWRLTSPSISISILQLK